MRSGASGLLPSRSVGPLPATSTMPGTYWISLNNGISSVPARLTPPVPAKRTARVLVLPFAYQPLSVSDCGVRLRSCACAHAAPGSNAPAPSRARRRIKPACPASACLSNGP